MGTFNIDPRLLNKQVKVALIGAGGTGGHLAYGLARLHRGMLALGHPYGLHVTVIDADSVSEANVGRQAFFPSEIGMSKAHVVVNRVNQGFGTSWEARQLMLTGKEKVNHNDRFDIVIGAVDNRKARKAILDLLRNNGGGLWLDLGNRKSDGQVILGQVMSRDTKTKSPLPTAADFYPEIIDESLDATDEAPSCSLAAALEKQSLFINQAMATSALNLLFKLFRTGKLESHGMFINLDTDRTTPLPVDANAWARMGYTLTKPKRTRMKKAA